MNQLVQAYCFGLLIAGTAGCERSVPVGLEGKNCTQVGATTSPDDGCCTCAKDRTWTCTQNECNSGTGGAASSTPKGTGDTKLNGSPYTGVGDTPVEITDSPGTADQSVMGDGTSNKTALGGYSWTFVDRSGRSNVVPDTGKIDPMDTRTAPALLRPALAPGNGIEDGAYHVYGFVGEEPHYDSTAEEDIDSYWDAFYGRAGTVARGLCANDGCNELIYPEAGIAFGFLANNAPLGAIAVDKVGIAFRMKLGPSHAMDRAGSGPYPVNVSLPMDLTTAPDPTMGDHFGTAYAGLDAPNKPMCSFTGTITNPETGSITGAQDKTCFRHMTTQEYVALDVTAEWQTFCLSWDRFSYPPYPPQDMQVTGVAEQKSHLIQVRFEAFKPLNGTGDAVDFDFWLDDVLLLDQAKWDSVCPSAVIPPLPQVF